MTIPERLRVCVCVCVCVCARMHMLSHVWLIAAPWTVAHWTPLSMAFSRQECWSWKSISSPGDLPDRGVEPSSPVSPSLAGRFFTTMPPGKTPRLLVPEKPNPQSHSLNNYNLQVILWKNIWRGSDKGKFHLPFLLRNCRETWECWFG